jgi:hypothetical protein
MLQASLLIALGAMSRLIPHFWMHDAWNLVPIGAIALFAGARLPKRVTWAIPVFAMILSDIVLDQKYGGYFHAPSRWLNYSAYASIALIGILAKGSKPGIFRLAGLSISGSVFFFLISNFGCWAWPEGTVYPQTFAGLMDCYIAGIPFFRNTVIGDLIGTALLFGLAPFVAGAWSRIAPGIRIAEEPELIAVGSASTQS